MESIGLLISFILHIDQHLQTLCANYGLWVYAILFVIVFCETGLVVTPFLPGDSLLFAGGAFAALGSLNIFLLIGLLIVAAVGGDTVNYWIGHKLGVGVYSSKNKWIKQEYIDRTRQFFEKHGGKTIILARFVPIIRTFAPFVAGIGQMKYGYFISYNIIGGITWVILFTLAGFFFGNIPFIKNNFSLVILAIIALSLVPAVYEAWKGRARKTKKIGNPEKLS